MLKVKSFLTDMILDGNFYLGPSA